MKLVILGLMHIAGYFGFNAHRELLKLGIANQVINAADIPTSDKDRQRKSDKIDAKKIAQCLLKDAEDIPSISTISKISYQCGKKRDD